MILKVPKAWAVFLIVVLFLLFVLLLGGVMLFENNKAFPSSNCLEKSKGLRCGFTGSNQFGWPMIAGVITGKEENQGRKYFNFLTTDSNGKSVYLKLTVLPKDYKRSIKYIITRRSKGTSEYYTEDELFTQLTPPLPTIISIELPTPSNLATLKTLTSDKKTFVCYEEYGPTVTKYLKNSSLANTLAFLFDSKKDDCGIVVTSFIL